MPFAGTPCSTSSSPARVSTRSGVVPQSEWLDSLSEVAQLLYEVVVLRPATEIRGELSGRACTGRSSLRVIMNATGPTVEVSPAQRQVVDATRTETASSVSARLPPRSTARGRVPVVADPAWRMRPEAGTSLLPSPSRPNTVQVVLAHS